MQVTELFTNKKQAKIFMKSHYQRDKLIFLEEVKDDYGNQVWKVIIM